MTRPVRSGRIVGALYLVTFATSIPALALKAPFLAGGGAGDPDAARWAALLEIVLALSCIGTAVAAYPVLAARAPLRAVGFVTSRTLEAGIVMTGVVALLALVRTADPALVAVHDAAFLVGPGLLPAVNAALFGSVLLQTRLVPRVIPIVGLVGAPLLAGSALATMFGVLDQVSPVAGLLALPIGLWEFAIGVWLLARGFRMET